MSLSVLDKLILVIRRVGIVEIDYKAIGQRIKIARIKKGIIQETVADIIDVTPSHMSKIVTNTK